MRGRVIFFALVVALIIWGVYSYGKHFQAETKQNNHDATCISGYGIYNGYGFNWGELEKLPTEEISRRTGISENQIKDCLGRW